MDEQFKKSIEPTRYLFLVNIGEALGSTEEKICDSFTKFGQIDKILMHSPNNSHLVFYDINSAIECHRCVDNAIIPNLSSRAIGIRFCTPKLELVDTSTPKPAYIPSENIISDTVPGLIHIADFISSAEEADLLNFINSQPWDNKTLSRRVQHYGTKFDYHSLLVSPHDAPIPMCFQPLLSRLVLEGIFPCEPNQITVNEYLPGYGIAPHVDTHSPFAFCVCSIGMLSDCAMEFSPIEAPVLPNIRLKDVQDELEKREGGEHIDWERFPVEGGTEQSGQLQCIAFKFARRSLMAFKGLCRFAFKHGIPSRKTDRYIDIENGTDVILARERRISLTFRVVREFPKCNCAFWWTCDTQNPKSLNTPTRLTK